MLFMYITTLFATVVTARNLYVTIAANPKMSGLPVAGAWAMIVVAALLIVAALFIGWDGLKAYRRYGAKPAGGQGRSGEAAARGRWKARSADRARSLRRTPRRRPRRVGRST